MMPLNPILILGVFDCWGINFMGPVSSSFGYLYILVAIDDVSKRVEVIPARTNDHQVVVKFLKEYIFSRFGIPRAIISYDGSHFSNKQIGLIKMKYCIVHKAGTLSSLGRSNVRSCAALPHRMRREAAFYFKFITNRATLPHFSPLMKFFKNLMKKV